MAKFFMRLPLVWNYLVLTIPRSFYQPALTYWLRATWKSLLHSHTKIGEIYMQLCSKKVCILYKVCLFVSYSNLEFIPAIYYFYIDFFTSRPVMSKLRSTSASSLFGLREWHGKFYEMNITLLKIKISFRSHFPTHNFSYIIACINND